MSSHWRPILNRGCSGSIHALKKGESVTLVGFGTFKVAERKARTGRNPQTGKEIKIKAKSVPKFVPGKALKEAVK
jgi:DNA-binding protein HU-beta